MRSQRAEAGAERQGDGSQLAQRMGDVAGDEIHGFPGNFGTEVLPTRGSLASVHDIVAGGRWGVACM